MDGHGRRLQVGPRSTEPVNPPLAAQVTASGARSPHPRLPPPAPTRERTGAYGALAGMGKTNVDACGPQTLIVPFGCGLLQRSDPSELASATATSCGRSSSGETKRETEECTMNEVMATPTTNSISIGARDGTPDCVGCRRACARGVRSSPTPRDQSWLVQQGCAACLERPTGWRWETSSRGSGARP
jgi:hypothetical protein